MIRIEEVAEFVSTYIGKQFPYDEDSIYANLDLVNEIIWNAGLFHGSTKWFYCQVRDDNTIVTPHGYNVLLGVNRNFKPLMIRDSSFIFHQNGPADIPVVSDNFSNNVYDLGEYPIFKLLENLCYPCEGTVCNEFRIGARAMGFCDSYPKTRIMGNDVKGNPIFTFIKGDKVELCNESEKDSYDNVIHGLEIQLTTDIRVIDNVKFGSISEIIKEPTKYPVEYYAVNNKSVGQLIARIEPFQTRSLYRLYKVPNDCIRNACVLGLFKRSKPDKIVDKEQLFFCSNRNAILSISKGVDLKYNKNDTQSGETLIALGIKDLAMELREQSSNSTNPLQMDGFVNPMKKKKFI